MKQPRKILAPSKLLFRLGCVVLVSTWLPVALFVTNPWLKVIGILGSLGISLCYVWMSWTIINAGLDDYLIERIEEADR